MPDKLIDLVAKVLRYMHLGVDLLGQYFVVHGKISLEVNGLFPRLVQESIFKT